MIPMVPYMMKRSFLAVLLAGSLSASLGAEPAQADFSGGSAASPLTEARDKIEEGAYEAALSDLQGLAAENPQDADVHNLLGYAYRKMGRYDESFEHYTMALEIDPEHAEALEYLGELYLQTDRLPEAEATLERLSRACGFFGCEEERELEQAISDYKAKQGS